MITNRITSDVEARGVRNALQALGSSIKNPESIDLPSSSIGSRSPRRVHRLRSHPPREKRAFRRSRRIDKKKSVSHTIAKWTFILVLLGLSSLTYMIDRDTSASSVTRRVEAGKVVQPSQSNSVQEMNLAMKAILEGRLREQGMIMGECGMFGCSKRWNDYMDAEIVRLIGKQ